MKKFEIGDIIKSTRSGRVYYITKVYNKKADATILVANEDVTRPVGSYFELHLHGEFELLLRGSSRHHPCTDIFK